MSRIPAYPSDPFRRARSPSVSESGATTRPLQINRPPTRPTTPSGSSVASGSPRGPIRPTRSGLRSRQVSDVSIPDRSSMESRTTRDSREAYDGRPSGLPGAPQTQPPRTRIGTNNSQQMNGRPKDPVSPPSEISPTSMAAVAAFQAFGVRRRATIDDADDEYERERQREIEVQKRRQQKIREKVPGRRTTGKAKAGDIDGVYYTLITFPQRSRLRICNFVDAYTTLRRLWFCAHNFLQPFWTKSGTNGQWSQILM